LGLKTGVGSRSGNVVLASGGALERSGDVRVASGHSDANKGGQLNIASGNGAQRSGDVFVQAGSASAGQGGSLELHSGCGADGAGELVVSAGSSASGKAGEMRISAGSASAGPGGNVHIASGTGSSMGGDVRFTASHGGNIVLQSGEGESSPGAVSISASQNDGKVEIGADDMRMTGSRAQVGLERDGLKLNGETVSLSSERGMALSVGEGELTIQHGESTVDGDVVMRIRENKIMSHIPADIVQVISPSDRRIKRDILPVDEDELLQRLQRVEVKRYKYSDAWRKVRGIKDVEVRGVIAQQLREVMPEYVTVTEKMTLPEKNFTIENFHEVDKIKLAVDLLAAVQAQQRRLTIGQNTAQSSGSIDINSAAGGAHVGALPNSDSGAVSLRSGASAGASGHIIVASGAGKQASGNVRFATGDAMEQTGSITVATGKSTAEGQSSSGSV
jgi:hypothetical protein